MYKIAARELKMEAIKQEKKYQANLKEHKGV